MHHKLPENLYELACLFSRLVMIAAWRYDVIAASATILRR